MTYGKEAGAPPTPWLKRIGIGALSVFVVFILIGLVLPTAYTVSRSIVIEADPEDIHEFVGDLRQWAAWGPWQEEDPALVVTYGEKTTGLGASQSWVGKDGDGALKVTASSPRRGVEYDLWFNNGTYQCRAAVRYHVSEDSTRVRWVMRGDMDTQVVGGYLALMMDSLVGPMFERGLMKLKTVVEGRINSAESPGSGG